jgi:hypothetical protein
MADVAEPLGETTSTAVTADTAATPSPSSVETSTPTPVTAGDTAVATDARSVFREMQAAKSDGTPPDTPPDPSLAQAATQPDGSSEAPGSLPNRGPIPFDRHQAVLTRTRNEVSEKARRETLAEFGIAEGVTPKVVAHGVNLARMLSENPQLFLQIVQSQLGVDAAPAAAAAPKPAEDPEPEPDIPLTDGRATFSADQLRAWHQWHERKLAAQMDAKYGPIRDAHEQQTLSVARQREAQSLVSAAAKWPLFDKLRPHVKALIAAQQGPLTPTSLHTAYITAYAQHGEKMRRDEWEAERSGQLTRKASASTVQPGAPRPSTPRPDSELTTREIIRQEARRLAAG